jgi:alpha-ribazole phosphatase
MTRVAFVRHGRAIVAENLCIGHTDVPLSPEGAASIKALATSARLHDARIVSSDLRRATESATIIAEAICHPERSEGSAVQHDARLREMDFGDWDGRSWADIERDDGERLHDWLNRWVDVAAPRGESAADVAGRATEWIAEVLPTSGEPIIVVSHAGWIRAALCHLLGRDLAQMFEIPVDYARATIVDVTRAGSTIIAANAASLDAIGFRSAPPVQVYRPSL